LSQLREKRGTKYKKRQKEREREEEIDIATYDALFSKSFYNVTTIYSCPYT
jgi:hypothetical protein